MSTSTRKIVAGLLSFAMVLTMVVGLTASPAAAQTPAFARNLTVGSRGADVTALQTILFTQGLLSVEPTGYFGALTQRALAAWQASKGITPAVGYFGPITRAAIGGTSPVSQVVGCTGSNPFNFLTGASCSVTPVGPVVGCTGSNPFNFLTGASCAVTPGQGQGGTLDNTDGSITASLSTYVGNTTIKKGETKDMVGVKLQATAGKVSVSRFDVRLNQRPWLYFSQITLKDTGGNTIATKNLSSASDATEISASADYLVRFEGLNYVVAPGADKTLVVSGTVLSTTDKLTSDVAVIVSIPDNSIRTVNGKGYTDSIGLGAVATPGTSGRTVTLSSTGSQGNVVIKANATQSARIQTTSTSGQTNDVVLGSYDIKAQNQAGTINTLKFIVKDHLGGASASSTVYKNLKLVDGSNVYAVTALDVNPAVFSNLNISLPIDTWKTIVLKADVADQDDFLNGLMASTSIAASATTIVGLDSNYNALTVTSATPVTPDVTFLSSGASVTAASVVTSPIDAGSAAVSKYAVKMTFTLNNTSDVDLYVSKTPSVALATSTTASSSALTLVTASGTNANDTTAHWVVSPGARTFTYDGVIDQTNGTSGSKEFKITRVYFDDDATGLQEFNVNFGLEGLRATASF